MRVDAIGLLTCSVMLGGCATLFSGSTQEISVTANVRDAEVYLDGQRLGKTPLRLEVDRGLEGTLSVHKEGYQTYEIPLDTSINPLFWVNILWGAGSFSSTTDWNSDAMYQYEPGTYFAGMQPVDATRSSRDVWRRKEAVRAFVLLNGDALVSDLAARDGEYVHTLLRLLDVEPERRDDAIKRWREAYASAETAVEFADQIVAELPSR